MRARLKTHLVGHELPVPRFVAMVTTLRVLIVDDHAVVREGIRHVFGATTDIEVVGEARSGPEAVVAAERARPDLVVLDLSMPEGGGLEAIPALRRASAAVRILVLSFHEHERYVAECQRAGAHGYLTKDSSPAELRDAVRALCRGDTWFATPTIGTAPSGPRQERRSRIAMLTPREREVLLGIVQGRTNKEIAARLQISSRTVESHRESLMQKLDLRTVAALTRLAIEEGMVGDG